MRKRARIHAAVALVALALAWFVAGCGNAEQPQPFQFPPPAATVTFVDLRGYGVRADCDTCNEANTAAVKAAIAAVATASGGPVNLHFPAGEIYLAQDSTATPSAYKPSIAIHGATKHDITISGEGMFATTLIGQGDLDFELYALIEVGAGAARIEIRDLGLQHGTWSEVPNDDKWHVLQLNGSTGSGGLTDVYIHDVYFGPAVGDAIRVLGNSSAIVDRVRVLNFTMNTGDHPQAPDGNRSGLSFQRGYNNVEVGNFSIKGPSDGCIDFEPSGAVQQTHVNVHDGFVDNTDGGTFIPVGIGGTDATTTMISGRVSNLTVLEGAVQIAYTTNLLVDRLKVIDTSAGPSADGTDGQLLYIYLKNEDLTIRDVELSKTNSAATGSLILQSSTTVTNFSNRLRITGGRLYQGTNAIPIHMLSCQACTVEGLDIRFEGSTPTGQRAILHRTDLFDVKRLKFDDIKIASPNGKLISGIWIAPVGNTVSDISITGINGDSCCTNGVMFDATSSGVVDPYPVLQGNSFGGTVTNAWSTDHLSNGIVFPIVAGSKGPGTIRTIEGTVTPESTVTGTQGDTYVYKNGNSTATYKKITGTSTTGWALVTSTAPTTETITSGAATPSADVTYMTTAGPGVAYTLGNGAIDGQVHRFVVRNATGPGSPSGTLTPTNLSNGTTHTISWTVKDCAFDLIWDHTSTTWRILGQVLNCTVN